MQLSFSSLPQQTAYSKGALICALALGLFACGDDDAPMDAGLADAGMDGAAMDASAEDAGADATMDAGPDFPETVGGDRPAPVFLPPGYDGSEPAPLLILLHGYGASGQLQDLYLNLTTRAAMHGMIFVRPDGTVDAGGNRFWNATDVCCGGGPDDLAYVTGLIDEMKEHFNIDAGRVYLLGHSNGGFMSYRIACDASSQITAIASIAGATFLDPSRCDPERPVSVLQVHGTADATIDYEGGTIFEADYPGAMATVSQAATHGNCGDTTMGTAIDLVSSVDGDESEVLSYNGCDEGVGVELWTIPGGAHIPAFQIDASDRMLTWLEQWSR